MTPPTLLILTATYNGARWLDEQLESFAGQRGVRVDVVVSDDQSTDGTADILRRWSSRMPLTVLPRQADRFGNANRNFMRLIREVPLGTADYICLSDQDDVWAPDKSIRAIDTIRTAQAAAYSSDVTAFWPDGRERVIVKSQPQRRLDHLFESAGPGCTFVFTREAFEQLRVWAIHHREALAGARVHDWAIYAYGRESGWSWAIDPISGVRYRQHGSNEIGANVGLRSALTRLNYILGGRYRDDILMMARVAGHRSSELERLTRFGWADRLALAIRARAFRRKASDALTLALLLPFMRRDASSDRRPAS